MRFYSFRCFTGKEQQPLSNGMEFLNHAPKSVLTLITNQYSVVLAMEDNHNKGEIICAVNSFKTWWYEQPP